MANNYSQFSELIHDLPLEAVAWVNEVLSLEEDVPEDMQRLSELLSFEGAHVVVNWPDFGWKIEDGNSLWLYSEEYFDPGQVALFVRELICRFMPDYVFTMSWAEYCSKLRPGEFGGGWMVISKDQVEEGSTAGEIFKRKPSTSTATKPEVRIILHPEDLGELHSERGGIDKDCIANISKELDWNPWAWCQVEVKLSLDGLSASAYLGCCSYEGEDDFKRSGYYEQMVEEAYDELNKKLDALHSVRLAPWKELV
jgi:hypothetical protein